MEIAAAIIVFLLLKQFRKHFNMIDNLLASHLNEFTLKIYELKNMRNTLGVFGQILDLSFLTIPLSL